MPSVVFTGKGKVDGQEYDKGDSDCSELQAKLDEANEKIEELQTNVERLAINEDEILRDFHGASKIAEYEAIKAKYPLEEAK